MYNTDLPNRSELPSGKKLMQSTILAVIVAIVLLVAVVLPAEYGVDPTRVGRVLGLTQMGEIKTALAREAEQDRKNSSQTTQSAANSQPTPTAATPEQPSTVAKFAPRKDEMTVTLKPGEAAEIKLEMKKDAKVKYEWITSGGAVNYDTHADNPQINYHGYGKGQQTERDAGELVAAFDGNHGWYWRNRTGNEVTVTLKTDGEYAGFKRVP
jgi:hypothetical protein